MKATVQTIVLLVATLTITAVAAGPGRNQGPAPAPTGAELTEAEESNILYMRLEEKLARDVYLTLAQMYDCPVFANIAGAEQRHMDAVGMLIVKYELDDLVTDDTVGEFGDSDWGRSFAESFAELTAKGAGSLLEALAVGVTIEEMDIEDLEEALEETEQPDVAWVFENLLRGSNNHLRAFTRAIAADGTSCSFVGRRRQFGASADQTDDQTGNRWGRGAGGGRQGRGRGQGNGTGPRNGTGQCDGTGPQGRQWDGDRDGQTDQQRSRDGSCTAPAA